VATLGTSDDEQFIDGLGGTSKAKFMLHYNFPPYSVGETGRMGGTSRRETGHGKLAWRALQAVLPEPEEFPYTVRLVSEITESNGSSSMATVCGCSLAMTSLQMDIKIAGITKDIMKTALEQAKGGRLHILGEMAKALEGAREELSDNAPQMEIMKIPVDKIRDVIGTGGKVIRDIVDTTGAKLNVGDDGTIQISALDKESIEAAKKRIHSLTAEAEVGAIYEGKVVALKDFGAFVNFFGPKDGLVHVSQMANERIGHPKDLLTEGQTVWVKLMGFDDRGKVRLSMKVVNQETGEEITDED